MPNSNASGPRREHRLALVLYGGVSLCIYMHGTTKEINRLVSASAALAAETGGELQPSEVVYRDLLAWKASREGVRTDVVVDVIAGTSAGGINGVYLAKALSGNRSQDALRNMWLKQADIKLLLRGPRYLPLKLRALKVLATIGCKPALRGNLMSQLLYDALASMDELPAATPSSLVPAESTLDLLVTTTDFYGYNRQLPIWDPPCVQDQQHRHVFRFAAHGARSELGPDDSLALAFAARATSCFPGAFEPVNRPAFQKVLGVRGTISNSLFRVYELADANPDETFFIDGGVLDNRPFAPAIEAIRAKPAAVDVERTLIYLDPAPEPPAPPPEGRVPGVIRTVLGAVSGLPRKQPIIDSLLEVDRMNLRVAELRDVIEVSFDAIAAAVGENVPGPLSGGAAQALPEQDRRLHLAARRRSEITYPTYMRARIGALLEALARACSDACEYPTDSTHAMLVSEAWLAWGEQRGLLAQCLAEREEQHDLLRNLDVEFLHRRLRFTLAGVNWIYEHNRGLPGVERSGLDRVKQRLWAIILGLTGAMTQACQELKAEVEAAFPEREIREFLEQPRPRPARRARFEEREPSAEPSAREAEEPAARVDGLGANLWVQRKQAQLAALATALAQRMRPELERSAAQAYADLLELTGDWPEERRKGVLVRYVGFPLWDAQLYPLESVSGAGERDAIKVMRTSPQDAELLGDKPGEPKLEGTAYEHFGAFLKLAWRENDYLIGRLNGAERLIRLLLDDDGARAAWSRRAFLAILEEEAPVLKTADELIATLRRRAELLPSLPA